MEEPATPTELTTSASAQSVSADLDAKRPRRLVPNNLVKMAELAAIPIPDINALADQVSVGWIASTR